MILFSLSKVCRIFSADCFISGFTASQSPQLRLRSIVGYTLLIIHLFCFQSFSLRYALKNTLKKTFSTCVRLHFSASFIFFTLSFCSYESTKEKLFLYHIWTLVRRFVGVFRKSFLLPHYNWKVTSRLLGYFTKILQKNCREIFPTTAYKKEVRYYSNFLFSFLL